MPKALAMGTLTLEQTRSSSVLADRLVFGLWYHRLKIFSVALVATLLLLALAITATEPYRGMLLGLTAIFASFLFVGVAAVLCIEIAIRISRAEIHAQVKRLREGIEKQLASLVEKDQSSEKRLRRLVERYNLRTTQLTELLREGALREERLQLMANEGKEHLRRIENETKERDKKLVGELTVLKERLAQTRLNFKT